ncbi:hypothetical protein WICPIJ_002972 [Wickerhamomyces pijperi]|uniref:Uncharacterized protein n=1 Tax=Wickerhamomyces pijperi TaxID=599730 RepID=A0A9P8Q8K4_WICPI|nr:hypothetical protein WICPIJ_002972 [Wickerhamomyces pijperi]
MAASATETLMTPCGPPLVAFWMASTMFFSFLKSMKVSPPNLWNKAFLSSPPSIPKTLKPIALAYWTAKEPKPPAAPEMATH